MERSKLEADSSACDDDPRDRGKSRVLSCQDRLKSFVSEEKLGEARRSHDFAMSTPAHLGLKDWQTFRDLMVAKMFAWNASHPECPITKANVTLDHTRPKAMFMHVDDLPDCNHYTNLQPLPRTVNEQKAALWSYSDEAYWREHIFKNSRYKEVYLPRGLVLK